MPRSILHRRRLALLAAVLLSFAIVLALSVGIISSIRRSTQLPGIYLCNDCPGTPWLMGVSMVSESEGWAVGQANGAARTRSQGVIAHYQNGQWTQLVLPADTPTLFSVYMLSASEGWIVGDKGTILHYIKGQWVSVDSPIQRGTLTSVVMLSPMDGWAVSQDGAILHYDGTLWTLVASIPELRSVSMISPSEGWAVGFNVIAHYYNGVWTPLNLSGLPSSTILFSVTMISASEGWAVGDNPESGTPIILHYQNSQWHLDAKTLDVHGLLKAVAMVSPDEGWAMGTDEGSNGNGAGSLVVHYTRADGWQRVDTPLRIPFDALSMISPTDGWAVGINNNFVHYFGGKWC